MEIKPLGKNRKRIPVLLVPGWRSLIAYTPEGIKKANGEIRCFELLKSLENASLYVSHSLKDLLMVTGSNLWQAELWKGHVTTMTLDGTRVKVHSLRRLLDDVESPTDRYQVLLELVEFLENRNVPTGSISAMAWNLWRSTMSETVKIGFDGDIGRKAFYGGRQEATPGTFKNMVAVDISSAYPFEMASRPYAGTLRKVSNRTILDPKEPGLAFADIQMNPNLTHAPLPVRISESVLSWKNENIQGWYTWQELSAAIHLGCKVQLKEVYAPATYIQPFGVWWDIVREARSSMSPAGAKLIKALSNSLWGMFGMTGDDRGVVRWSDKVGNRAEIVSRSPKKLPQANTAHIAAETTSRVRSRMLLEGLYGGLSLEPNNPVHIDTDGVIIPQKALKRFSEYMTSGLPGQWRVKQEIKEIEVLAPQQYRFKCCSTCESDHGLHYVASGMTRSAAEVYFEKRKNGFDFSLTKTP